MFRYWHRPLHVRHLLECKFLSLREFTSLVDEIDRYELPEKYADSRYIDCPSAVNLRAMKREDVAAVCALLQDYLCKFSIAAVFTPDELEHKLFLKESAPDFMHAFVKEEGGVMECSRNVHNTICSHFCSSKASFGWTKMAADYIVNISRSFSKCH